MTATQVDGAPAGFRHEALFYAGDDGFLAGVVPFLREAVEADEATLVVVSAPRIAMLRSVLGPADDHVLYADMATVGRNPARIIPAWRAFLDEHGAAGRALRGVGEPIWSARSPAELAECQRHEALLNVAFARSAPWRLACPYDVDTLPADVLDEAARSHPYLCDGVSCTPSGVFRGEQSGDAPRDAPLPEPARCLESMSFTSGQLRIVRAVTAARAEQFGMTAEGQDSFVLAVHEIAANSVVHGGGAGHYRLWREGRSLVCEISDSGRLVNPLAGRVDPGGDTASGRGLWIANQVCDLVQVRALAAGSVVRLHRSLDRD